MAHPSVAEILDATSGNGTDESRRHVQTCAQCRSLARAADPSEAEGTSTECARLEPLLRDLVRGRFARGDSPELDRHLADCEDCGVLAVCPIPSELK